MSKDRSRSFADQTRATPRRRGRFERLAPALLALALAGGCSSTDEFLSGQPPAPAGQRSFSDRFRSLFGGGTETTVATAPAAPAGPGAPEPMQNCPSTDIRSGAATLQTAAPGGDGALAVRYQATFGRTARQCVAIGGNLAIKVGVQGRLILGPAGAPGETSVPLRYALVREGTEPKTIWSKLYQLPVTIPEGQLNVPFTHVMEDLVVPMPSGPDLDAYVIYIGFDPQGAAQEKQQKKPQRGQKPKG